MVADEALNGDSTQMKIPGISVSESDLRSKLLDVTRRLCGWDFPSFPGSQPVSLSRNNLRDLNHIPYVACEKSDGVRYLLLCLSRRVWLIDRKQEVQRLDMWLPRQYKDSESQQRTLLDGEMVEDTVEEQQKSDGSVVKRKIYRYLVYDAVAVEGASLVSSNLLERLKKAFLSTVQPRRRWEEKYPNRVEKEKRTNHYLQIYLKDFFEIWHVAAIRNFSSRLPHFSDGIIFTPVSIGYIPGTCKQLLKWKPPDLNTVDFHAKILKRDPHNNKKSDEEDIKKLYCIKLFSGREGALAFSGCWLSLEGDTVKQIIQRFESNSAGFPTIWECYYNFNLPSVIPPIDSCSQQIKPNNDSDEVVPGGVWCVERTRTDKKSPNDERVVNSILQSIRDGVTFNELVDTFDEFRLSGKPTLSETVELPDYYKTQSSAV